MKKITLLLNLAMVYGLLFFFTSCDDKQAQRIIKKQEFKKLLYYTLNIYSDSQVKKALKDFERAKAAGYTHILLDDTKFQKLDIMGKFQKLDIMGKAYFANAAHLVKETRRLGLKVGCSSMYTGHASSALEQNPDLAEGFRVLGAPFLVKGNKAYPCIPDGFAIPFGAFENPDQNSFKGFAFQDKPGLITFADTSVAHTGTTSLRIEDPGKHDKHGRARVCIKFDEPEQDQPLLLTMWIKTLNFSGAKGIRILLYSDNAAIREEDMKHVNPIKPTQDWTKVRFLFNTSNMKQIKLWIGAWNAGTGKMWIDDIKLQGAGLLNIIQRTGCELVVKGNNGALYEEGRDYLPVKDEKIGDLLEYHEAPLLTLTTNSRIKDGDRLLLDYTHAFRCHKKVNNLCLSAPESMAYHQRMTRILNEKFAPDFWLMYHDEIRVINRCPRCLKQKKTPGQLLADNIRGCYNIIRTLSPHAPVYIWSDMVDPYHNMKKHYFAVNGSLDKSYEGLASDIIILKWGINRKGSKFFADRGLRQVVCGYYDCGDAVLKDVRQRYQANKDLPNVIGVCYASWKSEYDHIESWIDAVDSIFKGIRKK